MVYGLTRSAQFGRDFELMRQIRGAATSAMSNIAEGFDRWSRKEFVRFLDIAKGSAGEVRSQLYVAFDQGYITAEEFEKTRSVTWETSKIIGGLIGYLERNAAQYTVRETGLENDKPTELPAEFCNQNSSGT